MSTDTTQLMQLKKVWPEPAVIFRCCSKYNVLIQISEVGCISIV